jgi:hypothetical protein
MNYELSGSPNSGKLCLARHKRGITALNVSQSVGHFSCPRPINLIFNMSCSSFRDGTGVTCLFGRSGATSGRIECPHLSLWLKTCRNTGNDILNETHVGLFNMVVKYCEKEMQEKTTGEGFSTICPSIMQLC